MPQACGMFFVTKTNGVNQSPRFRYSHSVTNPVRVLSMRVVSYRLRADSCAIWANQALDSRFRMTRLIRKTADRSFNHSLVSAGVRSGWHERGDSKGRRDAHSAIVWYWRGEGLLTSISLNRQAPKDVELEKRTYFPSWIGSTCMTRALV